MDVPSCNLQPEGCSETMHHPNHGQRQSAISVRRERASDVVSVSTAAAPMLAVDPSSKEPSSLLAVPNSVSGKQNLLSYKSTYEESSAFANTMTSPLMSEVSGLDIKDQEDIKSRREAGVSEISRSTNLCPSNSTTMIMTHCSAPPPKLPQHVQGHAQECRDESSSMGHDFSSSEEESSSDDQSRVCVPKEKVSSPSRSTRSPRLTLSAFRRPEHTVRMTDSDPSRCLASEYDLHSPECRILGHGASSTVRLAIRRVDGVKVAVKRIAKHDALRRRRVRRGSRRHLDEWEILQSLSGRQGIVSLLDLFETDEEIQLVMEYCQGGELFDAIQKRTCRGLSSNRGSYTEAQAARITSQILHALSDLHSRGIAHRDVKPENILIMNEDEADLTVKLSDFGLARMLQNHDDTDSSGSDGEASPYTPPNRSRAYSCVGTDFYAAPEVCAGEGYDTAVDVYSLGVTLYVLLCGFPPSYVNDFAVDEDSDSDDEMCSVNFPSTHWRGVSEGAKELIQKMLHPDPTKRVSANDALKQAWIVHNSQHQETALHTAYKLPLVVSRPSLDLELVRNRLYKKLSQSSDEKGRKRTHSSKSRSKKRRRTERRASSSLMAAAMADLYRGVASAAASASAAAAGVVYGEIEEDITIVDVEESDESIVSSQFALSALSM